MSSTFRFFSRAWILAPIFACGLLGWSYVAWIKHVDYLTRVGSAEVKSDSASPTGYAGGVRRMIIPGHNQESLRWIIETQESLARGKGRIRRIDYENAPFGHETNSPSVYRWWLRLVGWFTRIFSSLSFGRSIEAATLFADPILYLILFVSTVASAARCFGKQAAAVLAVAFATLVPLTHSFVPALVDSRGLAIIAIVWSVFPLVLGLRALAGETGASLEKSSRCYRLARRWFIVGGVAAGVGLWISVSTLVPVLVGIFLGALVAAWVARQEPSKSHAIPDKALWQIWSLSGGITCLAAYIIEYYPAHLGGWQLRAVHPLYAIALSGGGAGLGRAMALICRQKTKWDWTDVVIGLLAAASLLALPVTMRKLQDVGFLATDLSAFRVTNFPGGASGTNLWSWLVHDGLSSLLWTIALPTLVLLPAVGLLVRRSTPLTSRASLAIALGPAAVALGFACWQLSWWTMLDGLLLVVLVVLTHAIRATYASRRSFIFFLGLLILVLLPGGVRQVENARLAGQTGLTRPELMELVERDLAHSLARRVGKEGAVILVPPDETMALCYYGGLRGLATFNSENKAGFGAAVRIASATTAEEAFELIQQRGVTHIIMPSWDPYLDEYARWGLGRVEGSFIESLKHWNLPPWLRPVPYQLPAVSGLEGQSVAIFEVVDEQSAATSASRLAVYFIQMGQLDAAASTAQSLRRFPADVGAWVARAEIELARGSDADLAATLKVLLPMLTSGADRSLPLDRRLGLAVVLARTQHKDLAREQVRRCLSTIDEAKVRKLSSSALYHLLVLSKGLEVPFSDAKLHTLALEFLPADWRTRL
ncbi:MAG TPA: hypothetical protein VFT72_15310 [Opitutaceae bacterium]|nr:hypothetical protein [Opitutaceae bacterium]